MITRLTLLFSLLALVTGLHAQTITSISPTSGSTAGGTNVTITGTDFTGATGVTIGGTAATAVTVVNDTTITATTPAGSAGTASVIVTTAGGSNAANTLYTYVAPPTVSAISPTSGSTAGGTNVTITGTDFTGATGVTIGGTAATAVTVVNDTTITATTPAGSAGTASVIVTTAGGSNAANTLYTYANEAPVITSNGGGAAASINVAENTTTVTTVTATDVDAGQTKTFSISGGADSAMFTIVPATGILTFTTAPNYEVPADGDTDNVYEVTVRIVDNGSPALDDTQTLSVTVTDVDEAPSITSGGSASFAENGTGTVYTAIGSDPESAALSYTLGGTDAGLFDINAASGAVTFKVSPDYEAAGDSGANNVYDITVTASDGGLSSTAQAVAITVTNVNEAPTDIALTSSSVDENVAANTIVGTFSTTDQDAGNTFTYSLVAGAGDTNNASFNISGSSLRISASPDFETKSSYSIRVRTTDQGSLSFEETFTISITDVNETPVITSNGGGGSAAISVAENTTTVTTVTATDVDAGQTKTFSISGGADSAMFSIVPATGVLTFASAPNYEVPADGDTDNVYEVTVRIVDNGSPVLDDTQTLSVTVTDANEAPVITSNSGGASAAISVAENTTAVTTVTATDVDASQTKTFSISGGADSAMFSIVAGTGILTFTTAPNYEVPADGDTDNVYEVTVRIVDNGSPALDDTQTLSVTVTDVDEAPSITSGGSASFAENGTGTVYTAIGSDPESAALSYTLGGTDAGLFDINAASGAVTFKVSPDYEAAGDSGANNVYDITVTASDGGLSSTAQAVAITVTNVNEAPVITSNGGGAAVSINVAENTTAVTTVTATDVDAGQTKTFSISGGADSAMFSIVPATGVLTFTTAPNYEVPADGDTDNVYEVIVRIVDNGSPALDDTQALSVTVTDANEAPVITSNSGGAAASISVAENTTAVTTVTATDVDASQTKTFSISGGADSAMFSIVPATGVLTFASAPNYEVPADGDTDNVYEVIVRIVDNGSPALDDTQTLSVTVTDVDEAPSITSGGSASFAENGTGTVYTAIGSDPESAALSYTLGGTDAGLFDINAASGAVTFKVSPDYEAAGDSGANNVYDITVTASDGGLSSTAQAVAITVTNVNEAPVITSNGGGAAVSINVAENTTAVTTVTATDVDAGQTKTFSISGGADSAMFSIVAGTGVLTFTTAPNYEVPADGDTDNVYEVIVRIVDNGSPALDDTQALSVTVTDANEAPVITSNSGGAAASISVAENTTAVTTVTATDVDAGQTKTFSISGGADSAMFSIVPATGILTFTTAPNYEVPADGDTDNVYEVTVRIVDNGSPVLDDTQTLSVTVTDVDEAPSITSGGSASFAENGTGTVYTAIGSDPESAALSYTLGGTDAGLFDINAASGAVTFKVSPDYEAAGDSGANNVYDITVTASDGGLSSAARAVAITVTDVNDAPVITSNGGGAAASINVAENTTAVTTVVATDADVGQTVTYSITGGADSAKFSIVPGTGVLTFATAPNFEVPTDVGADNVYDLVVTATDDGSPTGTKTQSIAVTVTNVSPAPTLAAISKSGLEDTTVTFTAANFTSAFTDPESGPLTSITVVTLPATGLLKLSGINVTASQVITLANLGNLTYVPAANENGEKTFTATATDGSLTSAAATVTMTLTAVNDAPVITSNGGGASASTSVAENSTAVTTVVATDVDLPTQGITYSITGGADSAKFSIVPSTGVLTFATAPNFEVPTDVGANNVYDLIVTATDDGSPAGTKNQSIAVTVTNVNEAPVITSNGGGATAAISVAENTTAVTTVTATDVDASQTKTYSISGGADSARFSIVAGTGVLTFTTAPNYEVPTDVGLNNVYEVTVRIVDNGSPALDDTQALSVTVTDANDAPVITSNGGGATASTSVAENSTAVTTVVATDADLPAQGITYSITGGADSAKFSIVPSTGVLTFTTAPNFEAATDVGANNVYDLIVTATDDGSPAGTRTQSIAVTVTNVNEAPVITSNGGGAAASINVAENTTAVTTVAATDVDAGQTKTYSISGGADSARFSIVAGTGVLTFTTAPNYEVPTDVGLDNVYDVTVRIVDNGSPALDDTQALSVTVTDANDAPVITSNGGGATASTSVAENSTAVTTVVATDADLPTQSITYSITGGVDAARFAIGSSSGVLTFVSAPNFESKLDSGANNVYDLVVTATDNGTPAGIRTQSIAVTVTNVNEAPVITSNGGGGTATVSIAENTTAVTTVTATDVDVPSTLTYSISGGADSAKFSINSSSGVLAFIAAPDFDLIQDANADNVFEVTVRVLDNGTTPSAYDDTQAISVTVTNVNETPVITSNGGGATAVFNVVEGTSLATTVVSTDPDVGQVRTYSITGGQDADQFTIDANTGALSFNFTASQGLPKDIGGNNIYLVSVRVSDAGTPALTDSQDMTITVVDDPAFTPSIVIQNMHSDTTSMTRANLVADINPSGNSTSVTFQYSTSATFASGVLTAGPYNIGSGTSLREVEAPITGLTATSTYYWRIVATNSLGTYTTGRQQLYKVSVMPSFTQGQAYGKAIVGTSRNVWGKTWGGVAPYTYQFDFGDGTTASGAVTDTDYIQTTKTYSTAGSKNYTLKITDANGSVCTRSGVIRALSVSSLADRVHLAMEKGLVYFYRSPSVIDTDQVFYNWSTKPLTDEHTVGTTGMALLAFVEHDHLPDEDAVEEIYAPLTYRVRNTLLGLASTHTISNHSNGIAVQTSDINANGIGIKFIGKTYADSIAAMAVALSLRSETQAKALQVPYGARKNLQTMYSFVQDCSEQFLWSMGDGPNLRGAFEYSTTSAQQNRYDGSAQQWPALALGAARDRLGISFPQWALDDFAYGFKVLKGTEGGIGYENSSNWNNTAKTGGALAALSFGEKWVDVDTDATSYRNYIAKYWTAAGHWSSANAGWFGQWYSMYGLKKGLSLQGVTTLTTPSSGTRDWKKDLNGWLLGEAATIDAQGGTIGSSQRSQANMFGQLADGSWTSTITPAEFGSSTDIDTATAILILSDAVTRAVPVAVIAPITDQTNKEAGRSFMVDGTDSYHLDADSAIAEYLWDWNASDGVNWSAPNASGALATNPGYTAIGTYTITLRVKDNKTPAATSITTTTVTVTSLDVSPIAVAKPIGGYDGYAGRVGMPITLTGTDSYDPDGDTIVSYSWDFNGDGIYGGAADLAYGDPTLAVTTVIYPTPYLGSIGLRVTANGKTSSNISDIDIQAGDADLRIDSVTYSNTVRRTSSDVSIQVTNDPASGRSFNNVLLRLYNGDPYAGGGPVGAVQTLNFSAGQTITVNLTNVDLGGAPILWAYLDTNNSVLEFDELNNISGPTRLDPEMDVEQPVGTALTDSGTASNFGTLIIGESSLKTYTITNSGTLNLTGIAATKDGTHSGDFILTQPLASSLAPGASTTFTVTYTPTAADTRTAAVHISSNDFDEAPFNISLTGFARAYPTNITLSTATINENNAANATVGTLTTTDTNVADTHTYSLVAGTGDEDNASFTIAANLLKLTPSADYETKITYNLRLRTTDQTGLTYDKAFVVTIGKLNEAPVLAATRNNPTSVESAGVATGTLGVNLFSSSAVTDIDEISASLGGGNIRVTFAEYITGDLIELPTGVTPALNAVQLSGTNVQISNGSAWTTIATRDATNTGIGKALTLTLNAAATEDNIGYVIDALMFRSTSDNPTVNQTKLTRTYSLVINDGNNNALAGGPAALDSNTIAGGTLTITPTNDFPVVDLNGATAGVNHAVTWTEVANGTHVTAAMTSSATMTDADNVNFSSMNFTLGAVLDGNSEVVTIGGTAFPLATDATNTVVTGGFKVSYNSTTDVFTIEPNGAAYATLASFQTLLNGVTYNNLTNNPTDGDRTFTVMVTDAGLNNLAGVGSVSSTLVTTTINVNPVNDQPVITDLVAASYFENAINAAAATLDATATVTDIDSPDYNGATLTVSGLVAAQDLVSLPVGAVAALDSVQLTGTNVEINDGSNWVVVGTAAGGSGNNFVVTFNASATTRSAELVIENLTFANSSNNPTLTRTLTLTLNDNDGNATQAATIGVTIKLDNDAPDITGTVGLAYTEQAAAAAFVSGATTSDPDQPTNFRPNATNVGNLRVALDGYVAGDLLSVANIGTGAGQIGVSGTTISYANVSFATTTGGTAADLVITFSSTTATPAAVGALINALRYRSTSDDPTVNNTDPSRVVTVTFNDGANTRDTTSSTAALTDTLTGNINLTAVNDLPVIVVTGAASYSENGLALTVDGTTTVTDLDDTQIDGGSVRISTGFLSGDTLAVTAAGNVTGSYDAVTGVLTLSGTDTLANYQTVLRSLTYVTANEDPTDNATKLTRVLTYSTTDANSDNVGAATGTTTKTINVTPSNDKPVVTAGATLAYAENDAATAIDGTITVNDADDTQITGATATISAGLTTGDLLAVTTQNGISGTYSAGTGVLTLTGTTTLANYQTALRSVTFQSTSEDPTATAVNRTVRWAVTDANSDLAGAQTSVAVTSTITITPSNDKPVVTAGATLAYAENAAATAIDATMTVSNADDTQITEATVTISAGLTTGDLLAVTTQNGISGTYSSGTGVLTLTGTTTLANYQTALRSVTFQSTSEDPTVTSVNRTVTWAVTDADSDLAGAQTSVAVTSTITITPSNDKPVVTAGATLAYAENAAATAIDGTMTVNDADDTQITGATATISAGVTAGDLLAVTTLNGISGTYSSGTGVLTLTGTATLAHYQAAFRRVTYQSTSEDPTVTAVNRTVTWAVTDADSDLAGAQTSVAVTSTITITPSNDKPVVTAGATLAYAENAAATAIDGTMTVNDVDDTQITGATATISAGLTTGDLLAVTTQNGISGTYSAGTGVLTLTGTTTLANYQTALRSVTFQSTSEDPTATAVNRTVTWAVTDANSDLAGAQTSVAVTSTITITPSNDKPVVTAGATLAYKTNAPARAIDGTVTVSDADDTQIAGATATISAGLTDGDLLAVTTQNGISGTYSSGTGVLTLTGTATLADYQTALRSVTYESTSADPTVTFNRRTISWLVTDANSDLVGAETSVAVTSTISINLNETPTDVSLSSATIAENNAANATVGTLSTTDWNEGDTFTYTLVSGTGSTDNGSFSISGDALNLTPSADYEAQSSYAVRVRTTDAGGLFYEEAFTISITDVNETPMNIALSNTIIVENNLANATVGTLSTTDVDAGETFTYTLVSGTGSTDNGSFSISGDALKLTPRADYEAQSSYAVRVRTTDSGGLFYERAFTITVGDINIAVADPDNRDLSSGVSAAYAFTDPQMMGTTSSARTFTISNPGTTPLTGIQVTMSGIQSGSFVLDTSATASSLAPGETTTFSVTFAPTYYAERQALIQVVHNGTEENPFRLGVVGTGGTLLATLAGGELTVSDTVNRLDTLNLAVSGTDLVLTGGIMMTNAGTGNGTDTVRIPLASITNGIKVNIGGGTVTFGEMIGYTGPLTVAPAVSGHLAIRVEGSVNVGPHPIIFNATQMVTITGALQASGAGLISITTREGILIDSAAVLSVENGDLTLSANQALPASDGRFTGINIIGASQVSSSGSGQVLINGKSGQVDGCGVSIEGGSTIRGGTTGRLAVNGLARGTGISRCGLNISGAGTIITTLGANIALTGTGAGSLNRNYGVVINSGASLLAVGNADLTITGTGGVAGHGVRIRDEAAAVVVAVANGDLTIIGHAGSGIGAVQGFHYTGGMSGRIESTGSGDLVINADTVEMTGTGTSRGTLQTTGSGSLTIKPLTSSSSIGLGGATGTLALSDAALAYIQNGFGSITIGDTNAGTGDVTIDTVTLPDSVVLAGGMIRNAGGADVILGTGDTLTLMGTTAPGASAGKLTVSGKLALADNETVVMEIGGLIAGSQRDQITASETVNIGSNVTLNLVQVGGYIPTGTETFTLIQRSGGTGAFAGMPEGYVFTNFFGSGQSATLTYLAGSSGHDIALEMGAMIPDLKIEHPVGTELVDSLSNIDLGKAAVTMRGLTKTFTITNTGTGDVTGLALSLTGTGAGDFAFSTLAANTLAQGTTTTFSVTFTPTALGNRTAVLHLASNINGTKNPFDIILNGTGVVSETIKPMVTITTPTSTTNEGAATVTGTVSDALGVAMVEVKLGTGAWVKSALDLNAAGTTGTYSLAITPALGVNVMTVRATDTSGNLSTLTRSFTHVVRRPLTLATAGTGGGMVVFTAPTTANASSLLVGSAYTLRATAAAGSFFNGWSSPNGSITIANPMASSLSFTMVAGAQITANFIANPFTAGLTGSYAGLIKAATGTTPAKTNAGLLTATLTSAGSFTANINLDGVIKAASGTFNPNTGNSTVTVANGATTWHLNLHLQLSGGTRRITGTLAQVTGGITGDVSDIVADRAAFSALNTVPVANRGTYNVALPARASQSNPSLVYPSGDGIGTVTVASTGVVTFRGTLADGCTFTQTAALSADLTWPIFIVFTNRVGSLSGLATLDETQNDSDLTASDLDWYLNAGASNYFPAGWNVGIKTDLIGARYVVPVGSAVLPGLGATSVANGNAELVFTGGNLAAGLIKKVNITTASIISRAPPTDSSFSAVLAKTTGAFSGNFNHSSGGKATYKGTILQKGNNSGGYGYFLLTPATAGNAGAAYLLPK